MISLTGNPPAALPLSAPALQREVARALEQKMTGIIRIAFLPGEELTLLVRNGSIRQGYMRERGIYQRDSAQWNEHVQSDRVARLAIINSPGRRLLFEKAILETAEKGIERKQAVRTVEMKKLLTSMENRESASLVRVHWRNAEAFVMVPGSKLLHSPAIFLTGGEWELDSYALDRLEKWQEPEGEVVVYRGGVESEAWVELHLNVLFEWNCNYLLTQYGYLTGKVMVTSILQNLLILSSQKSWEFGRFGNMVMDQSVFTSPIEATEAYKEILGLVSEHIRAVIGTSLLQSIKRQSMSMMNAFYQNLEKTYGLLQY
jgi:hypothetical protein